MDPEEVVQGQIDAYNARDLERYLSYYSQDAVVEDADGNVLARGHDAMRHQYGRLFSESPDLHVDVPQRIHVGAFVIDEEKITGFTEEGITSDLHAAVVYQLEGDKIASARVLR